MNSPPRARKPRFAMVFEADLARIGSSAEHVATIINVWLACCRLENDQRGGAEPFTFTAPIRDIASKAGLRYRACLNSLNALEAIGLLRISRQVTSGRQQPDRPSSYTLMGAVLEYRQPAGYAPDAHPVCTTGCASGADSKKRSVRTPSLPSAGGDAELMSFWSAYPRKVGKKAAMRAWARAKDRPPLADILSALERQSRSDQWRKDGGQFIPHPATWLNRGGWADELPTTAPKAGHQAARYD